MQLEYGADPERTPAPGRVPHKQLPCTAALQVHDLTPNIGMWWYFCAEMFPGPLPWFKACFHLGTVAVAGLITWRFMRTPVLVFLLQSIMVCFLKPYPSVADAALFMVKPFAATAAQDSLKGGAQSSVGHADAVCSARGQRAHGLHVLGSLRGLHMCLRRRQRVHGCRSRGVDHAVACAMHGTCILLR